MSRDRRGRAAEPANRGDARRDRAGRRAYRRATVVVITVLTVLAVGLGAAGALQGPRVRDAAMNAQSLVDQANARIVLDASQPLQPVDATAVRIEPAAAFTVEHDAARITLRFDEPLRYATDYRVAIDVRGTATGAAGTLEHEFTTPDAAVHTLVRSGDPAVPDRVVRTAVGGADEGAVLFEAPGIEEFAVLADQVVAVVDDGSGPRIRAGTADGKQVDVATPPAGMIRDLAAAPGETLFGYLVVTPGQEGVPGGTGRLFVRDVADTSGVSTEITGLGGAPLDVVDWRFVPGTSSVVVQTADRQLSVIDVASQRDPVPLGQHSELRGFLPGTVELVVANPTGTSIVDLTTGELTALTLPQAEVDPELQQGPFVLVDEGSFVERYSTFDSSAGFTSVLFRTDADGTSELYRPAAATSRIEGVCPSPNGEYLAVEVVETGGLPDGYRAAPGYSGATTWFVRADDGSALRGAPGMFPDWCA